MTREGRERIADWLVLAGALCLFASLFFAWSHQFSPAFLARYGSSTQLQGVPHDPTAWQVYSIADVLLALLSVSLLLGALLGGRAMRLVLLAGSGIALAFTIHALASPPTNGATIFDPATNAYVPNSPASSTGEPIALVGLGLAIAGLMVSFTAD